MGGGGWWRGLGSLFSFLCTFLGASFGLFVVLWCCSLAFLAGWLVLLEGRVFFEVNDFFFNVILLDDFDLGLRKTSLAVAIFQDKRKVLIQDLLIGQCI